jgi:hypothetical protein
MGIRSPKKRDDDPGTVEIHYPLTGEFGCPDEMHVLDLLEQELINVLDAGGTYTGREIGGGEAVLFFEATDIPVFCQHLLRLRDRVQENALLQSARLVIHSTSVSADHVKYRDLNDWLEASRTRVRRRRRRSRIPKVGNFYSIPLTDGCFGHAHYVHHEPRFWDIVQVLDLVTCEPAPLDVLITAQPMFPAIKTIVSVGISHGGWKLVGHMKPDLNFPLLSGYNPKRFS